MTSSDHSYSPAPALLQLRKQIDFAYPNRRRDSDGIMGDATHKATKSDHNIGLAVDFTRDEENGPDLEKLAESLIRDDRVSYIIFNRRIRNMSFEEGNWRLYAGSNPHERHIHISIKESSREDVSDWNIATIGWFDRLIQLLFGKTKEQT